VSFDEQQLAALGSNRVFDLGEDEMEALAAQLRRAIEDHSSP
jgi:hypothetical protein